MDIVENEDSCTEMLRKSKAQETRKMNCSEAVALMVDCGLSRANYDKIRNTAKELFPPYTQVSFVLIQLKQIFYSIHEVPGGRGWTYESQKNVKKSLLDTIMTFTPTQNLRVFGISWGNTFVTFA